MLQVLVNISFEKVLSQKRGMGYAKVKKRERRKS